jgi:hypothetical protein
MSELQNFLEQMQKNLDDKIRQSEERIQAAEDRIMSDQELIDLENKAIQTARDESHDFRTLVELFTKQQKVNREALATLYVSDKTHENFETFSNTTGIGLAEKESPPDKERIEERIEESTAAA